MTDFVSHHNLWHCHNKMAAVSFGDGHENCLNLNCQWQLTEFRCFNKKIYLYLIVYPVSTFYHNFINMFYIFYESLRWSLKMKFGGLSDLTDDRFHVTSQLWHWHGHENLSKYILTVTVWQYSDVLIKFFTYILL